MNRHFGVVPALYAVFVAMLPVSTLATDLDNYRSLYADRKAFRVGDTVQVVIVESTQAASSAGTSSLSSTDITASGHAGKNSAASGLALDGDTKGNGQTTRSGSVRSIVAAQVTAITPEGNLVLDADQQVVINDETQKIAVHGIVRPLDISPENDVASNRLAQATIRINGAGPVSSSQRRSVVFRFLKWMRVL